MAQQWIACLMGRTKGPTSLDNENWTEETFIEEYGEHKLAHFYVDFYKAQLCYYHGYYRQALELIQKGGAYAYTAKGTLLEIHYVFYYGLILGAILSEEIDQEQIPS